ncbi:hypothetical protein ON010_g3155 [Phytophthora cinnamomi]|nr:hypothetical protein ON010_g3155 [Phytophthora cinnamomi]
MTGTSARTFWRTAPPAGPNVHVDWLGSNAAGHGHRSAVAAGPTKTLAAGTTAPRRGPAPGRRQGTALGRLLGAHTGLQHRLLDLRDVGSGVQNGDATHEDSQDDIKNLLDRD